MDDTCARCGGPLPHYDEPQGVCWRCRQLETVGIPRMQPVIDAITELDVKPVIQIGTEEDDGARTDFEIAWRRLMDNLTDKKRGRDATG